MTLDIQTLRRDFPVLDQQVNGCPLVYLDNAATTQKPLAVINAIRDYYLQDNANVHRGVHTLSDRATQVFEHAREAVKGFVNAPALETLIWTRGTTESINLVARAWGDTQVAAGDRLLVTGLEHHSNIVPWQLLAERTGARVEPIPVLASGEVDLGAYRSMLDEKVRLVAVAHVSNVLGTVNPVSEMISMAHDAGALVLVDGAQAAPHLDIDVQALGCDFYAFSGHKMYGPTGIGVLYGKASLLEAMPPWHGGGEMVDEVSFEGTTFNRLPFKFEAGTPNIADAVGLGAAIRYLQGLDRQAVRAHEQDLLAYAHARAAAFEGLRRVGEAARIEGAFSFLLEGIHPSDVGMLLDQQGIAVRTGDHCAQPLMRRYGIPGTVRASFGLYNTREEVDFLFAGLEKAARMLS
jgi:cysteine desulfurase/selenocysteine lyase